MKRHNFFLPDELVAELRRIAAHTGVPMSEILRRVLAQWVAENKDKVPA